MRFKIALRNLYISQSIILLFIIFAYFIWFPTSYTKLGGFYDTAWMLIVVDLVLGPLLVLIVFKEGKNYLKFDINVLLTIQIVAFIYGAYALYLKHPVYNVFLHDRFKLVNASHANPKEKRFESLNASFFSKPIIAYAQSPENLNFRPQLILEKYFYGDLDINRRAVLYVPHLKSMDKILSKKLDPLVIFNDVEKKLTLDKYIKKWGGVINDYAFFPISGNNKKEMTFVLNKNTGKAVDVLDINPGLKLAKLNKTEPVN